MTIFVTTRVIGFKIATLKRMDEMHDDTFKTRLR